LCIQQTPFCIQRGGNLTLQPLDGEQVRLGISEPMLRIAPKVVPLGRPGTPEEASGGVLFLRSPPSTFVRGQVLNVTGGQLAGMSS
jgi:3-oxoacyl-[acyl-carrier protein] reductase